MSEPQIQELVSTKLIKEAGVDLESRPLLVFYACYLPDPQTTDYDILLNFLLARLDNFVESDYVLVLFAGGAKYQPPWTWMFKAYSNLGRNRFAGARYRYRKHLKNLHIVHPSLWPKLLMQAMGAVVSPKFSRKVYAETGLMQFVVVPLEQLQIPEEVLTIDAQYQSAMPASPSPGSRSVAPPVAKHAFGVKLEDIMGTNGEKGLPRVVSECIEFIRANGLDSEGIFRRSPASTSMQSAKQAYDRNDPDIDLATLGGVHVACVLLKMFFRDLPEPLFPASMYDIIRGIEARPTPLDQASYAKTTIFPLLSKPANMLIKSLFSFLHQVHTHSVRNLMNAHNLCIVWAPNLVRSDNPAVDFTMCAAGPGGGGVGTLVKVAIEYWDTAFGEEKGGENDGAVEDDVKNRRNFHVGGGDDEDAVSSIAAALSNPQLAAAASGSSL
ncbi:hypothetical protein HK104_008629 [Borealophlyctis nickersoniae]|nr:hypothetical protein HK104_008629 [Borealophlyctis nickersoniae]